MGERGDEGQQVGDLIIRGEKVTYKFTSATVLPSAVPAMDVLPRAFTLSSGENRPSRKSTQLL